MEALALAISAYRRARAEAGAPGRLGVALCPSGLRKPWLAAMVRRLGRC
jgi:hypothetical protein